jgi:D-sedoheptulose 7-phosphate isomerase
MSRTDREREAHQHLAALVRRLDDLAADISKLGRWGRTAARVLGRDGQLLAVGNGGSAAHAQHLVSELVGRYKRERRALRAASLSVDPSIVTALVNDYGIDEMFARQVDAHARTGDILVAFSTSGASRNVLAAVRRARAAGMRTWAFTGAAPNPLASVCDEALAVATTATATIQEVHQVAIHLFCEALDRELAGAEPVGATS